MYSVLFISIAQKVAKVQHEWECDINIKTFLKTAKYGLTCNIICLFKNDEITENRPTQIFEKCLKSYA